MPITKKSRRHMTPLARQLAELHNDAYSLARRLRAMADEVQKLEEVVRAASAGLSDKERASLADLFGFSLNRMGGST